MAAGTGGSTPRRRRPELSAASCRSLTGIISTWLTRVLTVVPLRTSVRAISGYESPFARSLSTSISRAVRASSAAGGSGLGAGRQANSSITRRVTDGERSASPRARRRRARASARAPSRRSRPRRSGRAIHSPLHRPSCTTSHLAIAAGTLPTSRRESSSAGVIPLSPNGFVTSGVASTSHRVVGRDQ